MTLLQFIKSKVFFKNLLYALLTGAGLIIITFLSLRIYTHHGQKIPVPDFRGLDKEELLEKAENSKLNIEIIDSVYNNDMPKGTVIEQNPEPGFNVKKHRRIFITLNAVNPEKVKMPNIVGVSHRQAKVVLKNVGLEIGKLIHVPDIAVNNVLKQQFQGEEIKPGTMIPKGSRVDLVLGKGLSNQQTTLPDLYEYTLIDAKDRLLRAALNVGAIIYDTSVVEAVDTAQARVWRQYPVYKENRKIRLGSTVDLWLSVDSLKFAEPDTLLLDY
ncbi:MAG: PASTA domain-containing protein [Bacteroidales bacterium]|jgi:beta-lactam-binding protein with PASTA domain|nr:PASTA domain-containing protein [Bacteroidales bacterium]